MSDTTAMLILKLQQWLQESPRSDGVVRINAQDLQQLINHLATFLHNQNMREVELRHSLFEEPNIVDDNKRLYRVSVVDLYSGLMWEDTIEAGDQNEATDNADVFPIEDMIHD